MFRLWRTKNEDSSEETVNYEGSFNKPEVEQYVGMLFKEHLIQNLVTEWIDQFGSELLAKIAPEEVEKEIKRVIANKIIK